MNMSHTYEDQTIDFQVIFKKRKTMGIYVDVYGNIELRVPRETTMEAVTALVEKKWSWIITKHTEMKERTKGFREKEYVEGETFLYLGESFPIRIVEDEAHTKEEVVFRDGELVITVRFHDDEKAKKLLTRFYKKQCKKLVESRIRLYQQNFKTKPKSIKISGNKKTWGTCNSLREMTFNWKLAMAPMEVVDYVVVHEMCHMVHMNHDRSFWRLVGKHIPDYEERQDWLKQSHWKMVV